MSDRPKSEGSAERAVTTEVKIAVCKGCHCAVAIDGLCSYECRHDANPRTAENTVIRVDRRTDELIGEESL